MLGALISYGVNPGTDALHRAAGGFWSVIISMYYRQTYVLLVLNLPLIPYIAASA